MSPPKSFSDYLSAKLRVGTNVRVYHLSTPPAPSSALFTSQPGQQDEETTCQSHFLGITQHVDAVGEEVLVLGIEVLVFLTSALTTIFVSKADSTGFLTRQGQTGQGQSVAQIIITVFLEYLLSPQLSRGKRLVLSLFARSQNQYLFPGSIENSTKHVLDDRQLIKWWCRVLDPIVQSRSEISDSSTRAYVVVPGCDKGETRAFYPASARHNVSAESKWQNSYPVELLVNDPTAPVRSLIPRLPDDPKARFCTDLDGEHIEADGNWRSIRSLDQFWEMMSYRQECSAGRVVGFIWVVFTSQESAPQQHPLPSPPTSQTAIVSSQGPPRSKTTLHDGQPNDEQAQEAEAVLMQNELKVTTDDVERFENGIKSPEASARPASPDRSDKDLNSQEQGQVSSTVEHVAVTGHIVMSTNAYEELTELLLDQLDFAGIETARKSTASWIGKIKDLTNVTVVGSEAHGQLETTVSAVQPGLAPQGAVNILTGVRKKRKIDVSDTTDLQTESQTPTNGVNTLSAGLIRKKAKPI